MKINTCPLKEKIHLAVEKLASLRGNSVALSQNLLLARVSLGELLGSLLGRVKYRLGQN